MVAAAASVEACCWFEYEAVQLSVDEGGAMAALNQLNATALAACAGSVEAEVRLSLVQLPLPPGEATAGEGAGEGAGDAPRSV